MGNEVGGGIGSDEMKSVVHGAELTDRDKQLIGYLATVRFMSSGQVQRLVYPGRLMKVCRRRLLRLAGLWKTSPRARAPANSPNENFVPPYLRRREFRAVTGELLEVWALTDCGYRLAERVLRTSLKIPRSDVSADHLERIVSLNELFVGMVDPSARQCAACGAHALTWQLAKLAKAERLPGAELVRSAGQDDYVLVCLDEQRRGCQRTVEARVPRVEHLAFEWTTSEGVQLPWSEYDRRTGKVLERMLRPDAMLVLPRERRRIFIEADVVVSLSAEEQAEASIAKATRYSKYAGVTPSERGTYAERFPDHFAPELLILVSSAGRAEVINAALRTWAKKDRPTVSIRVSAVGAAVRELLGDGVPKPRNRRIIETGELDALQRFYNGVIVSVKAARAAARAGGAPVPAYPPEAENVGGLLRRLLSESCAKMV